jgi:ubiquitin-protein ligase
MLSGMYKGGIFTFTFDISEEYPHKPPKVKCVPKVCLLHRYHSLAEVEVSLLPVVQIYHPNVDLEGNVCLNILREDWKPVLNLTSVMVGLQFLFLEPNADDPLNKGAYSPHPASLSRYHFSQYRNSRITPILALCYTDAAEELRKDRAKFARDVKRSLSGGNIGGEAYDDVMTAAPKSARSTKST